MIPHLFEAVRYSSREVLREIKKAPVGGVMRLD
jgi:hypothetical protein